MKRPKNEPYDMGEKNLDWKLGANVKHEQWQEFLPDRDEIESIIGTYCKELKVIFDIADAINKRLQGEK